MSIPLTLLGLLEREPSHGYDLKREYDTYFGREKPLAFGQVYATLARLTRDGQVEAAGEEPGAGPDRKRYVITEQGVSELESWLAEPVAPEPHLQTVLFVKVVLALLSDRSAEAYLDAAARRAPPTDARADGGEAERLDGRRPAGGSCPVPPGGRPALDRPDRGSPGCPRRGGAVVTAELVVLEARDVVYSFGQTLALRGASLSVTSGEILAVMGPSGSGKSTLLHCLAGILAPAEGEVWFDGKRTDTKNERERSALRRDRFGFVFQFGQLVPELTAEENVALPLLLGGVRRQPALVEARSWLVTMGLDGLERRRSGELSGGEAQRVALARGLVGRPEVLFADEPTGALDSLTGERVMDLLSAAVREQGTTVVLVTHEPRVAAYADREVIVRDGRVTAMSGTLT